MPPQIPKGRRYAKYYLFAIVAKTLSFDRGCENRHLLEPMYRHTDNAANNGNDKQKPSDSARLGRGKAKVKKV